MNVCPSLAASLRPLVYRQNVISLILFYRHYFGRCSFELAQLVLLGILIDCMNFLPSFLNVTRMSMSIVSFLA